MAYIRKKKIKGKTYYYVVEGVYEEGSNSSSPKQRVIRYLGNIKNILSKYEFWDKRHKKD